MIGQDVQDKLDKIVSDLQTTAKGMTAYIGIRGEDSLNVYPLGSDASGVVNAAQLANLQAVADDIKSAADNLADKMMPVTAAGEAFKTAQQPHQALIEAASVARKNLTDALEADAGYQAARAALDDARNDPDYVAAREQWRIIRGSENYGNISEAIGQYS